MEFLTDAGDVLGHFQFETVEIAVDQALAIAGIERTDWQEGKIPLPDDLGRVPKAMVAG